LNDEIIMIMTLRSGGAASAADAGDVHFDAL